MKKYFIALLILILIMAVIPTAADGNFFKKVSTETDNPAYRNSIIVTSKETNYNIPENLTFIDTNTGNKTSRSAKSVIYSLVGAAVDEDFTENEVKALAIAIHTQLCYENNYNNLAFNIQNPDIFIDTNNLKNKFGKNYTTLCSYCDNVYNALIMNSDNPADLNIKYLKYKNDANDITVYKAVPYSSLSSDYSITVSVGKDEFFNVLKELNPDISAAASPQNAVGKITYFNSGEANTVNICSEDFRGTDIADAFNLPYRRFTVNYSLGEFKLTALRCDVTNCITPDTAKFMSLQGNTYTEILNYCYSV